jgi:hypothetical protein
MAFGVEFGGIPGKIKAMLAKEIHAVFEDQSR